MFIELKKPLLLKEFPPQFDGEFLQKNGILFVEYYGDDFILIPNNNSGKALAYLSKYDFTYKIAKTDEDTYEDLYTTTLDIKKENQKDTDFEEDKEGEGELIDFLKSNQDLLKSEESAPVIQFVNRVFYQAIKKGASDIHVEPGRDSSEIRFRIDGVLQKYIEVPKSAIGGVINRLKVISHLDISEKRIPQDGRTQITIANKKLDIRVSSLPVHFGERIVLRILMQSQKIPTLSGLGLTSDIREGLEEAIKNPYGILLVTGPTGSGKSTTLYSILQSIKNPETNIMTIEDPVEYNLDGISQTQVNVKANLTFASGLRSILRQDPDVILIGEMRDSETSQIAIQSSLTGHLVFSTLHTNDAASSITRLVDMGIERFLISSTLIGVLAQRLIRVLCDECKKEISIDKFSAKLLGLPEGDIVYESNGCSVCNGSGFKGRIAVGEYLKIDENIKDMINDGVNESKIREYAMKHNGMRSLKDNAILLLKDGKTTLNEVIKVSIDK